MKLTVVSPLLGEEFADGVRKEVAQWAGPDTVIDVVKYYGFTQSCFVGRPDPSMSYLRK